MPWYPMKGDICVVVTSPDWASPGGWPQPGYVFQASDDWRLKPERTARGMVARPATPAEEAVWRMGSHALVKP